MDLLMDKSKMHRILGKCYLKTGLPGNEIYFPERISVCGVKAWPMSGGRRVEKAALANTINL
jgi:hypothetical protein